MVFTSVFTCDFFNTAEAQVSVIPVPDQVLKPSQVFSYPVLKGLKLDPDNPPDVFHSPHPAAIRIIFIAYAMITE